jgi:hypothetical protein
VVVNTLRVSRVGRSRCKQQDSEGFDAGILDAVDSDVDTLNISIMIGHSLCSEMEDNSKDTVAFLDKLEVLSKSKTREDY